jgi:DNA-binding NarL/FixJ family response regulator
MNEAAQRVLLVEDNPLDARCVEGMLALRSDCFELTHVQTLAEGLDVLAGRKADVVLLDLTLPDSCGLDTFTRAFEIAGDVPIVIVTGNDDARTALEAVRAGAQDFLVKSEMNNHVLVRALRYAVERGKLLGALRDAMARLKTLRGLLPICSCCKKIRDDKGYWQEVERYVATHTEAAFSHGYCPECAEAAMADMDEDPAGAK